MKVYKTVYARGWEIWEVDTRDIRMVAPSSIIYKGVISMSIYTLFHTIDGAQAYIDKQYGISNADRVHREELER